MLRHAFGFSARHRRQLPESSLERAAQQVINGWPDALPMMS
jgi:hypothetical protein